MPISGLVLSLSADAPIDDLVAELSRDSHLEVGVPAGRRLPVVLDTADSNEDRELWDWIRARRGVVHVDVSFIHFDDGGPATDSHCSSDLQSQEKEGT